MVPDKIAAKLAPDTIVFAAADVEADRAVLVTFARDLFATSFTDPDYFDRRFGPTGDAYTKWLLARTGGKPDFINFALAAGEPVGMMVVGAEPSEPDVGHLLHLYLCPAVRGHGLGPLLERQALEILTDAGFKAVQLNVGVENTSAIAFYLRLGWRNLGAGNQTGVLVMGKRLLTKES